MTDTVRDDDFLARLDAAIGCQQCGGPLGDSPSDDFCSDLHQQQWHAERADLLVDYREPWDRPADFPGIGSDTHRPQTFPCPDCGDTTRPRGRHRCPPCQTEHDRRNWRLPVQTSNLDADSRALNRARATASTDWQRAAVALRSEQLRERHRARVAAITASFGQLAADLADSFNKIGRALNKALAGASATRATATSPRPRPPDGPTAMSPRDRALTARRNRGTGPPPPRMDGRRGRGRARR